MKTIIGLIAIMQLGPLSNPQAHDDSSKSALKPTVAAHSAVPSIPIRLARVTAYWPGEDYYTSHKLAATGVRLRPGYCAVDSNIIPFGSIVMVLGVGNYLAMDTGTAVISRKAAKESGHNRAERNALVVDLYFPDRKAGELFSREGPKYAMVAWDSGSGRE
jgi:3D (Asp-Asp-Asp) domain-containing protein